jgi:hypothetical protein
MTIWLCIVPRRVRSREASSKARCASQPTEISLICACLWSDPFVTSCVADKTLTAKHNKPRFPGPNEATRALYLRCVHLTQVKSRLSVSRSRGLNDLRDWIESLVQTVISEGQTAKTKSSARVREV